MHRDAQIEYNSMHHDAQSDFTMHNIDGDAPHACSVFFKGIDNISHQKLFFQL